MSFIKRIVLFLAVNFLVMAMISVVLSLFHVQPYLQSYGLDYRSLMIFCLIWGMGGAFISLGLSRILAKWMTGVKIIDPDHTIPRLREFVDTVHRLCREAHMTYMPEVGIYESSEPNAFATGPSQKRSLIAVSSGLLSKMSQKELEGVIAHEITHIVNGDMVTMTLLQGIVNAFVMFLARILAFVFTSSNNKGRSQSSNSYGLFVFLFQFVFMILGSIVVAWFSRKREFRADAGGAQIAGRQNMIAALEALQRMQQAKKSQTQMSSSMEALRISTGRTQKGWSRFFASHPPLEERIERLLNS